MTTRTFQFSGTLFDGRTSNKHPVQVQVSPRYLTLRFPEGTVHRWSYQEVTLGSEGGRGQPVHLEHEVEEPEGKRLETLVVNDPAFLETVQQAAPDTLVSPWRHRRDLRLLAPALGLLFIPVAILVLWVYVLPALSDQAARRVPVSWEERLGQTLLENLETGAALEPNSEIQQVMDRVADRLLSTVPGQLYRFRVTVIPAAPINALALPGGGILVFQGLLNATDSSEELAGVLAHEFQHVLLRHSTRGVIRSLASKMLLTLMFGDVNSVMDGVLGLAGQLEGLRYNRDMEREADRAGMKMVLAAGIDPAGMVRIFKKLEEKTRLPGDEGRGTGKGKGSWLEFLSTHPAGSERVAVLTRLAEQGVPDSYRPLLPDIDWAQTVHRTTETNAEGQAFR